MPKTKLFIERARAVHGDLYDYEDSVYLTSKRKVKITCKVHGVFEQSPSHHILGRGCAACSADRQRCTPEEFEIKSRAIHGDAYNYRKVKYKTAHIMVDIICNEHGVFRQKPNKHLAGDGCPACGVASAAVAQRLSKDDFVLKARSVHGNYYNYALVDYKTAKLHVKIICPEHGVFEQTPDAHTNGGQKCPACSNRFRYDTESFIKRASEVHSGLYEYSRTRYKNAHTDVVVTCNSHGDFKQSPNNHIRGQGCPLCPRNYSQPTQLYIISTKGMVKIGFSNHPDGRNKTLSKKSPFKTEVVLTWEVKDTPTAYAVEQKAHDLLREYNSGLKGFDGATEWFNLTPLEAASVVSELVSEVV